MKRQLMMFDPSAAISATVDPDVDPINTAFDDELFELQRKLSRRIIQVCDTLVLSPTNSRL
jgi:hypothetical protein